MAPEVHALARVLVERLSRPQHAADREALHMLNDLGSAGWALDRNQAGLRADRAADWEADAAECEALGYHDEAAASRANAALLRATPIIPAASAAQQKATA